jgi:eukaryotic-like serine/threonine-protein kinase
VLEAGAQLGPYEIVSPIGAGGMGEVYKARDPRLNRTVAIKILPPDIAEAERRQRFEREAQAIASLNHPHICVVHDVGRYGNVDYLVMELLEGETLADRLTRGALPFDQLIALAIQICDALDKAHRNGVTHRDLKPGNVMLTKAGAKLLDFGLAKVQTSAAPPSASPSIVLTLTRNPDQPLTMAGSILGTLQYMSPEQIEGREADARSDIFAFGAMLYEMATGRRAFEGKSQVSLVAAILEQDPPPVSESQKLSPPVFDDVVRICLAKNPDDRWQSAADLVHELKLVGRHVTTAAPIVTHVTNRRHHAIWAAATVAVGLLAVGGALWLTRAPEPARVAFRIDDAATGGASSPYMIAVSPDGRNVTARTNVDGVNKLWVRPLERDAGFIPPGTDGASDPFWSPDARYIGFFADGKLKKVDVFGGQPQTLADVPSISRGGTWSRNATILFARDGDHGGIYRIAASGGEPTAVTELDRTRNEISHRYPRFLPDGEHFLFVSVSSKPDQTGIALGSLGSRSSKRIAAGMVAAQFAPPDLLLFLRESTLMAQRLDLKRLELSGDPFLVAEQVGSNPSIGLAGFTVSENGVLVYRAGVSSTGRNLIWMDRSGKPLGTVGSPALYENARLSPDGKRLAVFRGDGASDIWITDLGRDNSTRFTFDPAVDNDPVWSPDGTKIAFVSNRDGGIFNLYQKGTGGTGDDELLLKTPNSKLINDWSSDGRYILYQEDDPQTKHDLWVLPTFGDRKPIRYLATPFSERNASFSPDGRWIVYDSNESGANQIYVQSFPVSGRKYQISTGRTASQLPRWAPNGREIFYDAAGPLTAVDITVAGTELKAGVPHELFTALSALPPHNYDVTRSGDRFLVVTNRLISAAGPTTMPIVVVLNWQTGLRR